MDAPIQSPTGTAKTVVIAAVFQLTRKGQEELTQQAETKKRSDERKARSDPG